MVFMGENSKCVRLSRPDVAYSGPLGEQLKTRQYVMGVDSSLCMTKMFITVEIDLL